jgi:subtilisin family serine protease
MKWFFTPPAESDPSPRHDDDQPPGLTALPAALLQRHGALVLDPGKAAVVGDDQPPQPTVYRARTLLVPGHVLQDEYLLRAFTTVLAEIRIKLITPEPDRQTDRGDEFDLPELPRTAVLVPAPGYSVPVVVDAWVALQTLRAASIAQEDPERYAEAVQQISLEHLMISSAITGSPVTEGGGGIAGGPGSGGDVSGPTVTDSYLFSGADPRTPVAVLLDPPARKQASQCESDYGRRPMVAVLDTGIRAHPWLDVAADGAGGYTMPADSFVAVDPGIQAAIRAEGQLLRNTGDHSRQVIRNAWDKPMAASQLVGEFNPALGHCTFIAGIVRQVAPDARVLAVRILHSDDVAYEGDIICALRHLIKRIELAAAGDLAGMVDVVSLSFGYFSEAPYTKAVASGLWKAIEALLGLGVVVVAAAGNFATSREFYPAAFAREPVSAGQVPVISVGALNPNGTKAMFSDDGHWVTAWARGAAVVSTYPIDVDASRAPELRVPVNRRPPGTLPPGREALDPDDYRGGWAIWSGTSFSAPYLAALIARSLLTGAAAADRGLRLDVPADDRAAVIAKRKERAAAALRELREEEERILQDEGEEELLLEERGEARNGD